MCFCKCQQDQFLSTYFHQVSNKRIFLYIGKTLKVVPDCSGFVLYFSKVSAFIIHIPEIIANANYDVCEVDPLPRKIRNFGFSTFALFCSKSFEHSYFMKQFNSKIASTSDSS